MPLPVKALLYLYPTEETPINIVRKLVDKYKIRQSKLSTAYVLTPKIDQKIVNDIIANNFYRLKLIINSQYRKESMNGIHVLRSRLSEENVHIRQRDDIYYTLILAKIRDPKFALLTTLWLSGTNLWYKKPMVPESLIVIEEKETLKYFIEYYNRLYASSKVVIIR